MVHTGYILLDQKTDLLELFMQVLMSRSLLGHLSENTSQNVVILLFTLFLRNLHQSKCFWTCKENDFNGCKETMECSH